MTRSKPFKWSLAKTKMRLALLALIVLGLSAVAAVLLSERRSPEENAQKYYERGVKLAEQGDYAKASIELRNAVSLKGDLVLAWRSLAQIEETTKNWPRLITSLRAIVSLDPSDVEARIKLAKLLLLSGAANQALTLVDAANEVDKRNGRLLGVRAAILYKLNYPFAAVEQAQDALSVEPSNPDALVVLAKDRVAKDDLKGALNILESDDADLGIQLIKLNLLERLGDSQQLENLLRKLMTLYPEEAGFRRQLIRFYVDQHRNQDAEIETRKIIEANPTNADAELDLVGLLYLSKGATAAKQELLARINAGGEVFRYQIALAELEFYQGNFADSEQLLQTLTGASSSEQAVVARIKLAEMDIKRDRMDAAAELVSEVLRKDAHNTDALKLRASIRIARGELEAATTDLRQALNDQPQSAKLMLRLAEAYERGGSIAEAEKLFSEAARISNFDPDVGLSYVSFLERRGRRDRADAVLAELAKRWPKNLSVLSTAADNKLADRNWNEAKEIAGAIRNAGDTRDIADQVLGAALIGEQKYDESVAVFERALATTSPSATQPMVSLVDALVRAQKTDQAMSFLKSTLESNPDNAEAHVLMGSLQLKSGASDDALKSFKLAVESEPKNVAGYKALAELYIGQKKFEEALDVIRSGLQIRPDSMILHYTLAGALERAKQYEAAINEYEYILKQQSGSLIAANNLASLLCDHRKDKESLERARSLAKILRNSPVPQFEDTLGCVSYRLGEYGDAVALLERAADKLPNSAMVHYHLGMSYMASVRAAEGVKQLKTARSLGLENDLDQETMHAFEKLTN
ncbi:MAG TPA: tetratricopeptide repeat protein [Nitrososphaera sp.]|nr:tetratricopeptide repeat protein [Nitrososphaera sp.]